jgi:hypothetical protein
MANTFNNTQVKLSSTNVTDLYQAPSDSGAVSIILSIMVSNVDGTNSADISVIKATSGNTEVSRLAHTIPVPPDTSLEIVANKLVLKASEKLRVQASAADDLEVTLSCLEIV